MIRSVAILALLSLGFAQPILAQQSTSTPPSLEQSTETVEGVIEAFYGVWSRPQNPDWETLKRLCAPSAQFNMVRFNSEGKMVTRLGSLQEYMKNTYNFFKNNEFQQVELNRSINHYDHVATVNSTYQANILYKQSGRQETEKGVMMFQLIHAKGRWYITSVTRNTENPSDPIPASLAINAAPAPTTTSTATNPPAQERVETNQPYKFESGIEGYIYTEQEVESAPQYGSTDSELFAYLGENLTYPEQALKENAGGTFAIEFIVDEEGWINNVKVYETTSPAMANELFRVFNSMPQWTPGKKGGKAVNCRVTLQLNIDPK